uniref:hypothetical protein n=1 Tax=Alistipes communis TaxID=2585118 RepID=UPI003FD72A67
MRTHFLLIAAIGLLLSSCNRIPNKSVFTSLDTKTLAGIIKHDSLFIEFYERLQDETKDFNEIEKAKFNDITYRKLYSMVEFSRDTAKLHPLWDQWMQEWENEFGMYEKQVDSVIDYWVRYKADNSLDRFVKIEFAAIDKDYYTYSHDVKNVNFAFKLTPLDGKIEQLCFNYRYSAKINNVRYAEKHSCISTSPFSTPVTRYWEVGYSDEKKLKYKTSAEFRRDYDILFEITEVRKDGVNYSLDDLNIPEPVEKVLETDSIQYPYLHKSRKGDVIQKILCPAYQDRYDYTYDQFHQLLQQKFPKESAFMDYTDNK